MTELSRFRGRERERVERRPSFCGVRVVVAEELEAQNGILFFLITFVSMLST